MHPNIYRDFYEKFMTDDTVSVRSTVSCMDVREYAVTKESLLEKLGGDLKISFSHTVTRIDSNDRASAFADFAYFTISRGNNITLVRVHREEPNRLIGVVHFMGEHSYRYCFSLDQTEKAFAHEFKLMCQAALITNKHNIEQ